MELTCTRCDEDGYTERDRSYGDYTAAVREVCSKCDGTKRKRCQNDDCDNNATRCSDRDGAALCDHCFACDNV